jgi:hypothetical protein
MADKPAAADEMGPVKELLPVLLGRLPGFAVKRPLEPATFLHEAKADLQARINAGTTDRRAELVAFFSDPNFPKKIEESAQQLLAPFASDPRLVALQQLVDQAETKAPLSFLEDIYWHFQDPLLTKLSDVLEKLEKARKLTGESQSRAMKDALEKAGESLYLPFLRIVWNLTGRAQGKLPSSIDTLGKLIKDLEPRLPAGTPLLDKDAGWLRNGATHEDWRYLPVTAEIEVRDKHHPPVCFKSQVLLERVEGWCILSVKILWAVMQSYQAKHWQEIASLALAELSSKPSTGQP